jgi:hypothetical protein
MPKLVNNKPYVCPYCTNTYATENSVYGHVKTSHPGLQYSRKQKTTLTPNAQVKVQQLHDLKERFINDEITPEQYTRISEQINRRYETPVQDATLDVGKVMKNDRNYMVEYLNNHPSLGKFIDLAASSNYLLLCAGLFKHQIRISNKDTGKWITYLDDGKITTKECEVQLLIDLYKRMVNCLAATILPKILKSIDDLDDDVTGLSLQHSYENQQLFNNVLGSITSQHSQALMAALTAAFAMFDDEIIHGGESVPDQ